MRTSRQTLRMIWRKDRKDKKGCGVMLMIKCKIKVINVKYGKGKAELISAQILDKIWRKPKNGSCICILKNRNKKWTREEHEEIIEDTLQSLEKLLKAVKE